MSEWISVEDRLPREDGIDDVVLVYEDKGGYSVTEIRLWDGKLRKFIKWDYGVGYIEVDVSHWMSLPDPPKVSDE